MYKLENLILSIKKIIIKLLILKIKYRFNEKIRNKLLDIKWEEITDEFIKENIDILEKDVTEENIDEIIKFMRLK